MTEQITLPLSATYPFSTTPSSHHYEDWGILGVDVGPTTQNSVLIKGDDGPSEPDPHSEFTQYFITSRTTDELVDGKDGEVTQEVERFSFGSYSTVELELPRPNCTSTNALGRFVENKRSFKGPRHRALRAPGGGQRAERRPARTEPALATHTDSDSVFFLEPR